MNKVNKNIETKISTHSDGYKHIEFTNYSTKKVSDEEFIDGCINILMCIKRDLKSEKKKWFAFWKSEE